jgi:two-component system NtrC family response regulator
VPGEGIDKPKLLIVEDDEDLRVQMRWALEADYDVSLAGDHDEACRVMTAVRPGLVALDLGLPPRAQSVEEGFRSLDSLQGIDPAVKVVVITGRAEREHALAAVAAGACDYMWKPVDVGELKVVLRRALQMRQLQLENRELQARLGGEGLEGILGRDPVMRRVFAEVRKVAGADVPVLVTGESGTGKELVARAIHALGARSGGPFVAINCGAIPESLLESELFGHEKGAFTGAHVQRKGRLELAQGGTLFLDEIGELPATLQVKLLRFLQDHRMERVGGRQPITVDARVVTASNADLQRLIADGRFREDLYFRVGVVKIVLPPLRERGDDVGLLARVFLERYAAELGKAFKGFTPEATRALASHDWPGNVRELENRVRRAVVMADGSRVTPADLELTELPSGQHRLRDLRAGLERDVIRQALARNDGNVSQTAAELGISRPTLYDLMEKLGIPRR